MVGAAELIPPCTCGEESLPDEAVKVGRNPAFWVGGDMVTDMPLEWRPKKERPYGKGTIIVFALFATWNLLVNLASIPDAMALSQVIQEAWGVDPMILTLLESFLIFYYLDIVVWFVIVILQYALAYGLSKPRRWARKAGMTSVALGLIMSLAWLIFSAAVFSVAGGEMPTSVIAQFVWNLLAFFAVRRFLNKPEVRDYLEFEGREKRVPFMIEKEGKIPFMIEEPTKPEPTLPEEPVRVAEVEIVEEPVEEPVEKAEKKHCRYCGALIPEDSIFCEECGKKLR